MKIRADAADVRDMFQTFVKHM